MFNRKIKSKLPDVTLPENFYRDERIRDFYRFRNDEGKRVSDKKRHAKESQVEVGDEGLVRRKKQNKLTTPFITVPLTVLEKNGNSVTVQGEEGVKYRRNTSHVKRYLNREPE